MTSPPAPPLPAPLVAPREDSTRATSGVALVETGDALHDAIVSGSWRDGALAGLGFGIELAAAALDPLGALAAAGIGWLMEHVRPLSDLLDRLTGDPDAVAAQARTWRNVAVAVRAAGEEMGRATAPGDDWTGDAADAFTRAGSARAEEIRASAVVADALGAAVEGAGSLVSLVREVVRELIAQLVATLVVRVPQWALEEVGSLGLATPHVVASAVAVIAKVTTRVVRLAEGLVRSLRRLGDLVSELLDLARRLVPRGPTATPTATAAAPTVPARAAGLPAHPFGPGTGTRPAGTPSEASWPAPTAPARAPTPPPEPSLPPEQRTALAQRIRAALEPEPPTRPAATLSIGEGLPPVAPGVKTLVDRIPDDRVTRGADGLIDRVDGRPYRDVVRDLARQRAEEFRTAQAAKELSAKSVGSAASVAVDRRTGAMVEATNGRKGAILQEVHPELRRRYDDLLATGPYPAFERDGARLLDAQGQPASREHPHPDHPLRHSEVKAIDGLLRLRGAGADRDALQELAVDTFFPFGEDGARPAPSCANCTSMMGEAVSISGKLSHFPGPLP